MSSFNFRPDPYPELPKLDSEQSLAFQRELTSLRAELNFEQQLAAGMPEARSRWIAEEDAELRRAYLISNTKEAARVILPLAASMLMLKFYAK